MISQHHSEDILEMVKIKGELQMLTEQQKKDRMLGIGGSDMPIILGLSNYKTPYQLYLEKTGQDESGFIETDSQEWGNLLEGVIRKKFAESHNVTVQAPEDDFSYCPPSNLVTHSLTTFVHPLLDFMRGNIDGFIPEWNAGLEIKTSSGFMSKEWGEEGSDTIPMQYLVQVAYYCAVLNADSWHIAVLIGGNDYREYTYTRDMELELKLIDAASAFWGRVQNKKPPEPINQIDLRLMFPLHDPEKSIVINDEVYDKLTNLYEVRAKLKELNEQEDSHKFNIMKFMETSECLVDEEGRPVVTWKANKRGSRTFLVKGGI